MQTYYISLIDPNTGSFLNEDGTRYDDQFKVYFETKEEIEKRIPELEEKYPFANIAICEENNNQVDERFSQVATKYYEEKRLYDAWKHSIFKKLFKKAPELKLYKPRA